MKKLLVILLSLILMLFSVSCAPGVFRDTYDKPTQQEYASFLKNFTYNEEKFFLDDAYYKVDGSVAVEQNFNKNSFLLDLDIDNRYGKISGKTVYSESGFATADKTETVYESKKGYLVKRVGAEEVTRPSTDGIEGFIDMPSFYSRFLADLFDNLQSLPLSDVEIANTSRVTKLHIKITPQSASALFFYGLITESAAGDIYLCLTNNCFVAVRGVFKATISNDVYTASDIISAKTLSKITADINLYAK